MGLEIERKYLVKQIPSNIKYYPYKEITQSYISTDPTIRLRKIDESYVLTIKGHGHIVREEFEMELTKNQYDSLSLKTENLCVFKTRYFIPIHNNLIAELDIYHGYHKDLVTVEVEFTSMEEATNFDPPKWFGEDISQNKRYKNSFLSKYRLKK